MNISLSIAAFLLRSCRYSFLLHVYHLTILLFVVSLASLFETLEL